MKILLKDEHRDLIVSTQDYLNEGNLVCHMIYRPDSDGKIDQSHRIAIEFGTIKELSTVLKLGIEMKLRSKANIIRIEKFLCPYFFFEKCKLDIIYNKQIFNAGIIKYIGRYHVF